MKCIIITKKIWDKNNFNKINKEIILLNKPNKRIIKKINPKIIFFIHWSKLVDDTIFKKYLCIQFHSSNLPKGRGGSPIQNQVLLGIKKTKLSAFKITKKLDFGPLCLQENLSLNGSALEIYKRIEKKSLIMIKKIVKIKNIKFYPQKGLPTYFKRRFRKQSKLNLNKINNLNKLYDFLRMLDAPGYPKAFIELNKFKFIFSDIVKRKKIISAKVKIINK